jgi:hypothetical protein
MEGPGLDAPATSAAVCEFHMGKRTDHFPHTMQQIYPCWSYWRNHGGRKVLKLPRFFLKRPSKFLDGITKALEEVFDVEITTRNVGPAVSRQWVGPSFRMLHAEDASELASKVRAYYNVNVNTTRTRPRIGIINRRQNNKRSIINVETVASKLHTALGTDIDVAYFEEASFLEQVEFFSATDILISPHGAQLTGLPFMAGVSDCAAVVELFPRSYFTKYFYYLANVSGIKHYGLYFSDRADALNETKQRPNSYWARNKLRSVDFCIPEGRIGSLIQPVVDEWLECYAGRNV